MAARYEQQSLFDLLTQSTAETGLYQALRDICYSLDHAKVLAEGYRLIIYHREDKKLEMTAVNPLDGWIIKDGYATYAATERALKEILSAPEWIAAGKNGTIGGSSSAGGEIRQAGFEFYRIYGLHDYDSSFCIKQGSKNWSNWGKYSSREELQAAWDTLMATDMKALRG